MKRKQKGFIEGGIVFAFLVAFVVGSAATADTKKAEAPAPTVATASK